MFFFAAHFYKGTTAIACLDNRRVDTRVQFLCAETAIKSGGQLTAIV